MIDRKVLDQLILSRQLLSKQEGFASAAHDPSQLLRDLLICHGAAELALAAICVQLNCVPDKKDIGLSDYFDSISRTTQPALTLQGADYVAELDQVRM